MGAIHFVPKRGTTSSHQTIMELNHVVELSEAGFDASGRVVSRSGLSSSLGPGTDVVNLAWDNVKYEVLIKDPDNPKGRRVEKEIIHGVSGAVLAGQMLAILGGSGAGKSTLLDILAQRKSTGSITGSIYLNGTNVNDVQILFTRCSGYVTQEDIFLKTMTVRENLRYFATMTLGGLSRAERYAEVENVMEELNISHVANSKIGGVTDSRGLSGGEKKRVSIAESLLRRPKILFLDEPTSGLDSYNSQAVMELLNNLAIKRQMTIVASIHQPRSTIFDLFDKLMILQRGKTAFFGDASAAQSYFEKQGYPLPMGFNPPDFFIDVVLGKSNATTDFPSLFGESDLCKSVLSIVDEQKNSILHLTDGNLKPYAVSYPTQLRGLLGRWGRDALRNPEAFIVGAIQAVVLGCLVGSLFYNLPSDASGSQSRAGMLFLSLIFGSFTITNMAVMITQNRALVNRERASGIFAITPFWLTRIILDLPAIVIIPLFFNSISYWMVGLNPAIERFWVLIGVTILTSAVAASLYNLVGALAPDPLVANILATVVTVIFMLFAGFFTVVPNYWVWIEYISFVRWAFVSLMVNEFEGTGPVGEQALQLFELESWNVWNGVVGLVCQFIIYRILTLVAFRFVHQEKR